MLLRWLRNHSLRTGIGIVAASLLILSTAVPALASLSWQGASLTALTSMTAGTKQVTNQANFYYQQAMQEIKAGNEQEATRLLQRVLTLDPQHRKAATQLAQLQNSGVSISAGTGTIAQAQIDDDLSVQQLMQLGSAKIDDGDFAGAQAYFEKALAQAESEELKSSIRKYLQAIANEIDSGQAQQNELLEADLTELEKHLQKATHYMEGGMLDEAEQELWQAQRIAPDDRRVNLLVDRLEKRQSEAETAEMVQQRAEQTQVANTQKSQADALFREGVDLYRQGLIIEATQKWEEALQVFPEHQQSQTYLNNTNAEYEAAVEAQEAAQQEAAQDTEFEEMLEEVIPQYSTQGERADVKDVYSTLSNLSGLNFVLGENLEGQVAFDVKEITIRELLNRLQHQYGFVWHREGDTVYVEQGFESRVFKLDERQFETIELILNDASVLEDSSRNLRTILYGQNGEFDVPGKQLYLNRTAQSLVVTDTPENLRVVESFLDELPNITGDQKPIIPKVYVLEKEIARDIYNIIQLMLYGEMGEYDVRDPRRKLLFEESTNTMVVLDYPENIDMIEETLSSQQFTRQLEEGELFAKEFQVTDVDDVEASPEALARRQLFVEQIQQIIESMLIGAEGRDRYALSGRKIFSNPDRGTITVVDTKSNIRKVERYLQSVRGESTQDILIEEFPIQHLDVYQITDALSYLFFDSQQSTRATFISQGAFQSIGTTEQGDVSTDVTNIFEETTRDRFNLTGGGGGATDLLQFFSLRMYPDPNTNTLVIITPDQDVLDLVSRVINTFDKPLRQIQVEQRTVRVGLSDLRGINFDWVLTNPLRGEFDFDPDRFENDIDMLEGSVGDPSPGGVGFSLNTLGESRLDFLMSLLEETTNSETLNSSKMISIPNPPVFPVMFVGQQVPFAQDVTFEDQGDDDPTNNRINLDFERALAGSTFAFLPFILNDGSVYLELVPQIVTLGERVPVSVTGGELPPGQQIPDVGPPILSQIYLQAGVRVKDGDTVVLGGQVTENEEQSEDRIPFLSKIPFIGTIFKDQSIQKTKNTILTFVTVQVIEPEL